VLTQTAILVNFGEFLQALDECPEFSSSLLVQSIKASTTAGPGKLHHNARDEATVWEMQRPRFDASVGNIDSVAFDEVKTVLW